MASTSARPDEFLTIAEAIGRRISAEAIWYEDRCNWLGAEPVERREVGLQTGTTYRTLGPDLYSGTSGVALFLAELTRFTGDHSTRRTAHGAIRHALSRVESLPPPARLGLFSGWIGIALVAVRVSMILDEPALLREALDLVRRCSTEARETGEFDLVSGRAGGISGLVVLNHLLHDATVLDFAIRLGDELIESAEETDIGYSWKSPGWVNERNLTGFSHGVAGCGYALIELFHTTGISKYRDAAIRAFQYERHWFDSEAGNWPDFRKDPSSRRRKKARHSCLLFWCHGAPGIALSRLRAYDVLREETCKAEAEIALRTTCASLHAAIDTWTGNFSMCHGLAGNAEVLLYGAEILPAEFRADAAVAVKVARYGIERYAERKAQWPCGTRCGETPNFMLGLAGIGHVYLRLSQASIPSVLILRKDDWARLDPRELPMSPAGANFAN